MTPEEKLVAAHDLRVANKIADAERMYREVLEADPHHRGALRSLASMAHQVGRDDMAIHWLKALVTASPTEASAWSNLATAHFITGDFDAARACYGHALEINPNHAGYRYNLATLLKDTGDLDAAIEEYRQAIRIDPTRNPAAWSNLLYLIHFHPDYDPPRIFREHERWVEQNVARLQYPNEPHRNDRSPDRKLRIGYVSPLLREHTMACFLMPLFEGHDREHFEIAGYGGSPQPDAMTDRYRAACERWRDTAAMSHEQLARQIRADEIDILVDLNLHMAGDRLEAFARKPAPVQVTYLGYPSTTGLRQIDWRITDEHLDPPGENDAYYAEKSFRLPWNFYWKPIHVTPDAQPPLASSRTEITFGCLNSFTKVTSPTVELWGRVMSGVPDSRLIVMAGPGAHRRRLVDRLATHSIASSRIDFVDYMPQYAYLATYHRIDIALDTFPCPGHATTCDALWMGVPVVTLPSTTAISRGGVSILSAVGLPELIASSPGDCVSKIANLAGDADRRASLRQTLRDRMLTSPLMDAARFVRDFESAYRAMWRQWAK